MKKRKPEPIPRPATTLTLHLGDESRAHLERCRQLLTARDPADPDMTLGAVVRIALRRLLLGLLGERADWTRAADPIAAEYIRELETQLRQERRSGASKEPFLATRADDAGPDITTAEQRGGVS